MRTYQLIIAYDGSRFRGWQRQPDTELTIQGILEKQISALAGYPVEVQGAGRTDGGVHAAAQTASIQLAGKIEPEYFREKLNQCLPEDIRVLGVKLMKNSFHARYSACGKRYEYAVDTGVRPNVFLRKYKFHYPEKLDIQKMRQAAAILEGTHDFTAFTDRPDEHSARRRIYQIQITESGNLVNIKYIGSGFMYGSNFDRNVVGSRDRKTDAGKCEKSLGTWCARRSWLFSTGLRTLCEACLL